MNYYTMNEVAEKLGAKDRKVYDKIRGLCMRGWMKPAVEKKHIRLFTDDQIEWLKKHFGGEA